MSEGGEYTDEGGYRHTYSTVYRGKQRYIDGGLGGKDITCVGATYM